MLKTVYYVHNFREFNFVGAIDYENILTTKISRFTVTKRVQIYTMREDVGMDPAIFVTFQSSHSHFIAFYPACTCAAGVK